MDVWGVVESLPLESPKDLLSIVAGDSLGVKLSELLAHRGAVWWQWWEEINGDVVGVENGTSFKAQNVHGIGTGSIIYRVGYGA